MMGKLIYGVGVSTSGSFPRYFRDALGNKQPSREYRLWFGMLNRCYSEKELTKNPSYLGCSVSENFKNFQFFADWCNKQVGFMEGYQLDKDLLFKGNRVYSECTCLFVPREINVFLTKSNRSRGAFPIGVSLHKKLNKYQATGGGNIGYLGIFNSVEDAFNAYKIAKETQAKTLSMQLSSCIIDSRCLQALNNYIVEMND